MTCGCNQTPCTCENTCETPSNATTLCDLDRKNNVWVEGADAEGNNGICLLDTIEEGQLIEVLQRDPLARTDLKRVTSNVYLQNLVDTLPMLPTDYEGDTLQHEQNQGTLTLYNVFHGVPPFNQ
jgi:hypothetical protein